MLGVPQIQTQALLLLWVTSIVAQTPSVTEVFPRLGSVAGGTRITVKGENFAANSDAGPQNDVLLVTDARSYPCDPHPDGDTTTMITCYTRKMPQARYYVKVTVQGVPVTSYPCRNNRWAYCTFYAQTSRTPDIQTITPNSGSIGEHVQLWGKIMTNYYGSNIQASNTTNGVIDQLLRAYMGGQNFELLDDNGNIILIQTDGVDGELFTGIIEGYGKSRFIGCHNISYIVGGAYGRSLTKLNLLRVLSDDEVCAYEQFPEITGVSQHAGSTQGGTYLTLTGTGLTDTTRHPTAVTIAGSPCAVQADQSTDVALVCLTPAEVTTDPGYHGGNRGLLVEVWYNVTVDVASLASISSMTSPDVTSQVDETHYKNDSPHTARLSGYFVAPDTADFMFSIKGENGGKVYFSDTEDPASMAEIASFSSTTATWKWSPRKSLIKNNKYYMQVVHSTAAGVGGGVTVGALRFTSPYNAGQSGWSINELQRIVATSTIQEEVQTVDLSAWPAAQASVPEVQTVTVETTDGTANFRLSMGGSPTGLLAADIAEATLVSALEGLETLPSGSVSVAKATTSVAGVDTHVYTVTINTPLGGWPLLVSTIPAGSAVSSVSVARQTAGTSARTQMSLQVNGQFTAGLAPAAGATQVEAALKALTAVGCPDAITAPTVPHVFLQDFEDASLTHVSDELVAFCGARSLVNDLWLYKGNAISVSTASTVCFAYRGKFGPYLNIRYSYRADNGKTYTPNDWLTVPDYINDEMWHYRCLDVKALLEARRVGGSSFFLRWVRLGRGHRYPGRTQVDAVFLGSAPPTADWTDLENQRRLPAVRHKSLTVTYDPAGPSYNVSFSNWDCLNPDPLVVRNAASADVTVTTVHEQSAGLGGKMEVTWNGRAKKFKLLDEPEMIQNRLENINGIGSLRVTRSGYCGAFTWSIEFRTNPGEQPLMTISSTSAVTGAAAAVTSIRARSGGLHYQPLPGHTLRTHHTGSQVNLLVNNVPARCQGDCSFTWDAALTPSVTTISPTTGSIGTVVTIDGTGFDAVTITNNVLLVGDAICSVSVATVTRVTCALGAGAAGTHVMWFSVRSAGAAIISGAPVSFTYTTAVTSSTPSSGGLGGGLTLAVSGGGFTATSTVTVGGTDCPVVSVTSGHITCIVPRAAAEGVVAVAVTEAGATVTGPDTFSYLATLTPDITAVNSTVGSPIGGEVVEVTGLGFGAVPACPGCVTVGGRAAQVITYTDQTVLLRLPGLTHGSHELRMLVTDQGYATATNGRPTFTSVFEVTAVSPTEISAHGGLRLTITGQGLDVSTARVYVTDQSRPGVEVACERLDSPLSATTAVCHLGATGKTWTVTNGGLHPVHGAGYAWTPEQLAVEAGDSVRFQWAAPAGLTSPANYMVQQIDDNVDNDQVDGPEVVPNGFNSGAATPQWSFVQMFATEGVKYYWSGAVSQYGDIDMRGMVNVGPKLSFTGVLHVRAGDVEATHTIGSSGRRRKKRTTTCTPVPQTNCTAPPTSTTPNSFTIGLTNCLQATVTEVTPNNGTASTTLTLTGTNFGTDPACLDVRVGQPYSQARPCTVSVVNDTVLECTVQPGTTLDVGIAHAVTVDVLGLGSALSTIQNPMDARFALLPEVTSVTPAVGSIQGGTDIVITGSGFYDPANGAVLVSIDGIPCAVTSYNYTQIDCTTGAHPASAPIQAALTVRGFAAVCVSCDFIYQTAATPSLTSASPTTVSGPVTLTLTGTGFGAATPTGDVKVKVGTRVCPPQIVTDTQITCTLDGLEVGAHGVSVRVTSLGTASDANSVQVTGTAAGSTTLSPTQGSTQGYTTLVIGGNGFIVGGTTVTLDGSACSVSSVTISQVTCTTPAHADGAATVVVTSGGTSMPSATFTYSTAITPTVTTVTPAQGAGEDTVTLAGTALDTANPEVTFNGVACAVQSATATSLLCVLGSSVPGAYPAVVTFPSVGRAVSSPTFTYSFDVTSITPSHGGYGGGLEVTLAGSGLSLATTVSVCDAACVMTSATGSAATCLTPANAGSGSTACDVVSVAAGGAVTATLTAAFTYTDADTPHVTDLTPTRGGTAGGTILTITGDGFGTSVNAVTVTIDGAACSVLTTAATIITCRTSEHNPGRRTLAPAALTVTGKGLALSTAPVFEYVDRWSSATTWGLRGLPGQAMMVVVPRGQTLLLDIPQTPVLKMLLIQGELIFDEMDTELRAENILVTDGGLLQIGTAAQPFAHQAIITMYGNLRAPELPMYGAKTLGVRNGSIELHGERRDITWSQLHVTVTAGSNEITLIHPVDWRVGEQVVIASTGGHLSQNETELFTISGTRLESGRTVLTLNDSLSFDHLGELQTFQGGFELETRAEVGLLTRNIVFRGSNNPQWNVPIAACAAGFDPGEFAVQTCFQGRFGDEIGSDQFGGALMISQPSLDAGVVQAHIEFVEFYYVGQAFRLGRYPIHLHLNGDMSGAYIRGCSIHHTFNRAINIHNTHNVLVEHNVVYNVMGGALFLEDSIETGIIFQYNLVLFVKSSSSLLNDDVTPAAFWITHPNNTVRHNNAAGGTHFGVWYRMLEHPQGPSADNTICPRKIPLGEFFNNTAHSLGWYGLWIFETYEPTYEGTCSSTNYKAAVFRKLVAWNNLRGAEWVDAGPMQFQDFVVANNLLAGLESFFIKSHERKSVDYDEINGPLINNSVIIGHLNSANHPTCTKRGLVLPFGNGLSMLNVAFVNFEAGQTNTGTTCSAIGTVRITCICRAHDCAGYNYKFRQTSFHNAPMKSLLEWVSNAELEDMDGTLTGQAAGTKVVSRSDLNPSTCVDDTTTWGHEFPAQLCPPSVDFLRVTINQPEPVSLLHNDMIVSNQHGTLRTPWSKQRSTNKEGWMIVMPAREETSFAWSGMEHLTNISYHASYFGLEAGVWAVLRHNVTAQAYDQVSVLLDAAPTAGLAAKPVYGTDPHAAHWFDEVNQDLYYLVSDTPTPSTGSTNSITRLVQPRANQCYYPGCVVPDGSAPPAVSSRPTPSYYWSAPGTWQQTGPAAWTAVGGTGAGPVPTNAHDVVVTIPRDLWVVVDQPHIIVKHALIEGALEFDYENDPATGAPRDFLFEATVVYVDGGRVVAGWDTIPFAGQLDLTLHGDHATAEYPRDGGPLIGNKAIAVFGALELRGVTHDVYHTQLAVTAQPGDTTLVLQQAVDWQPGALVLVASSSYDPGQLELANITAVSADRRTLTLDAALVYKHLGGENETFPTGASYDLSAEVALLSRNIRIRGADSGARTQQSYGARVLVGTRSSIDTSGQIQAKTGYAYLSAVEFAHTGQHGWVAPYDPRFSLAYLDTGAAGPTRPSAVLGCAFHHGMATAIGVFGTAADINVTDNVVHRPVGPGIKVEGSGMVLRHNLVVSATWPGYLPWSQLAEPSNNEWPGAIDTMATTSVTLTDNRVAGADRVGFAVAGESCATTPTSSGNVAHSCMIGVYFFNEHLCPHADGCAVYDGYSVYRSWSFGFYSQSPCNLKLNNLTTVDAGMGAFGMVIGPKITTHHYERKTLSISNSAIVGQSPAFNCAADVYPPTPNLAGASLGMGWRVHGTGKVGLGFGHFSEAGNMHPLKPFHLAKKNPTAYGYTTVADTVFAHFGAGCNANRDVILSTNPLSPDMQHVVSFRRISLQNVDHLSKVFYHQPSLSNIKLHGGCVDMDCDGKKKALLRDEDSSFLGGPSQGSVVPNSAFEWGGDPRRGLGDYRIPITMRSDSNGNPRPLSAVLDYPGIIGTKNQCAFQSVWNAYECHGPDYGLLYFESMDPDYRDRRLGPTALRGMDDSGQWALDLENGPRDVGTCRGYQCTDRISFYQVIVDSGKAYDLYMTSTTPQHLRLHYFDPPSTSTVVLGIYYGNQQRIDVYVNQDIVTDADIQLTSAQYVRPRNMVERTIGGQTSLVYDRPAYAGQYTPQPGYPCGANFFDLVEKVMYISVRGGCVVDIVMTQVVVVDFGLPMLTIDQFYGANIVQNLANFLHIPPEMIRVVSIIPEGTTTSGRKKRATPGVHCRIEVGNHPAQPSTTSLDYNNLNVIYDVIVTGAQDGTLAAGVGYEMVSVSVVRPVPPTNSTAWTQFMSSEEAAGRGQDPHNSPPLSTADHMVLAQAPKAEFEDSPFPTQPAIKFTDAQGKLVPNLMMPNGGAWRVRASLDRSMGSPGAALLGNTLAAVRGGWANFTGLRVSRSGVYRLNFRVDMPASYAAAVQAEVTVRPKPVQAVLSLPPRVSPRQGFAAAAHLVDTRTNTTVTDLNWKGLLWTCALSLDPRINQPGELQGSLLQPFDGAGGLAEFPDLQLTSAGRYLLQGHITTEPHFYVFYFEKVVNVGDQFVMPPNHGRKQLELVFNTLYDNVRGEEIIFTTAVYNRLKKVVGSKKVEFEGMVVWEASVHVNCSVVGLSYDVVAALDLIVEEVLSGDSIRMDDIAVVYSTLMRVDGEVYKGLDGTVPRRKKLSGPDVGLAVGLCVAGALLLMVIISVTVYFCCCKNKRPGSNTKKSRAAVDAVEFPGGVQWDEASGKYVTSSATPPPVYRETTGADDMPRLAFASGMSVPLDAALPASRPPSSTRLPLPSIRLPAIPHRLVTTESPKRSSKPLISTSGKKAKRLDVTKPPTGYVDRLGSPRPTSAASGSGVSGGGKAEEEERPSTGSSLASVGLTSLQARRNSEAMGSVN